MKYEKAIYQSANERQDRRGNPCSKRKSNQSAEKQVSEPIEVIDSFFQSAPADAKPLWYLGESLKLLATADVAYFAKGWDEARGCKIENTCAIEYGIETIIEDYTEE